MVNRRVGFVDIFVNGRDLYIKRKVDRCDSAHSVSAREIEVIREVLSVTSFTAS